MGYCLYPIFFYLRGIIRNKKMATTLHFNITTKKVKVDQTVSQDLYGIITGPSGVAFVTRNAMGNELIDGDTESIYFNLPLDTSNGIVYGTYTLKYSTAVIDLNNPATYTSVSFTYLGADVLTACFTTEHNCDYYPTGLISATDSTYYGNNAGTASSPTILSRTLSLFYPDGLVNPTPAVNPAQGIQSPITTGNYTLTVDTLATGMWTAIMNVQLLYTQDDNLVIEYQLKKTLNHNVSCVGQLCSINECIDGMTQAFNSDVACGVTTPRYAKQLTLMNSYFSQYQMERACGNTDKANEYLNLMNELVGGESSCGCSGSGSCSGSCGSSCSCDSCGDDNTPRWINVPGSTTLSVLEQMQNEIDSIQIEIDNIPAGPQGPIGPQGPVGPQGIEGPAGEAGANGATGETGATGPQGPEGPMGPIVPGGLVWEYYWHDGTTYQLGDVVLDDSNGTMTTYVCVAGPISSTTPPYLDPGYWVPLTIAGVAGSQGPIGPAGTNGATGATGATGPQGTTGSTGSQGVQGPAGVAGPVGPAGLNWQGTWVSGTPYIEDDAVSYNGASYFCILATSGTTAPDLDFTHWALLASQGATGPQGVQGPTGSQGPAGPQGPQGIQGDPGVDGGTINFAGLLSPSSVSISSVSPTQMLETFMIPANTYSVGDVIDFKMSYTRSTITTSNGFRIYLVFKMGAAPTPLNFDGYLAQLITTQPDSATDLIKMLGELSIVFRNSGGILSTLSKISLYYGGTGYTSVRDLAGSSSSSLDLTQNVYVGIMAQHAYGDPVTIGLDIYKFSN